jgi:MFS family permease
LAEEKSVKLYQRLSLPAALAALLVVAAAYVVNAMDRIVFPVLLPSVAQEYGFPLATGGLLATVFTLGLGIAGIPGGYLFDWMSRKSVAILGIVIYSACTILTCVSVGFYDMVAYRAISGIGEGFQNAAIFTMAGGYFFRNRTLSMGFLNAAYGLGSYIGPRWGATLLAGTASWRVPLYTYGVIGLAGAVMMLVFVSRRFSEQHPTLSAGTIPAESHIPERLLNRNTAIVALAASCSGIAGYGYLGLYPTFLVGQLHFSVQQAGDAASVFGGGALFGIVCGYLADRVNQKWMSICGLLIQAIAGYALFNVAVTPATQEMMSFLVGAAFSGILYVNNYSLMQRSVRSALTGRASGLVVTSVYLPAALSGYLFAELRDSFGWGDAALLQMTLLPLIPLVAMLALDLSRTSCPVGARQHGEAELSATPG